MLSLIWQRDVETMSTFWKDDWEQARENLTAWWEHRGLALCARAPKEKPWEDIAEPARPSNLRQSWLDPDYRVSLSEYQLSRIFFGGESFPHLNTLIGPGSLGTFLGSEPGFAPDTVWYHPCITDPDLHPAFRFCPQDYWFRRHMDIIEEGLRRSRGRYLVGLPDLIENIDILAQMRDPQVLMVDLIERPRWVKQKVSQINQVFFSAFDAMYDTAHTPWGGNVFCAFGLWGPGKTAKLQCDASAMFSCEMFREFVMPALTEQCRWLDYSMYHLDGTQAMHHLDALLEIDALSAIQWTPQAGVESGGSPRWYDLYRRILAAGKSVQAGGVAECEVIPLLDAVGSKGMFINTWCQSEESARNLVEKVRTYRVAGNRVNLGTN